MRSSFFKEYRTRTRVLWFTLLGIALPIVGLSIWTVAHFPISGITVLFLACFTSVLLSQFKFRLPKTNIEISIGNVIAIWGVLWLGVSGGVLLGAAASLARLVRDRDLSASGILHIFLSIVSMATAAVAFSVWYGIDIDIQTAWAGINNAKLIVIGSVLISVINFIIHSLLDLMVEMSERSITDQYRKTKLLGAAEVPFAAALIIGICALFAHFGIAFGLLVLPTTILAIVAYKIHLTRLDQKTAQILEASRLHLATVEALATAIDARDQIGSGHVRRTQVFAVGLGMALGLSDGDIEALRTGALLHDIGKLAVPDHILSKPGSLTHAELEKTKIHASVGASILETIGFQYPVVPTVKYHHESWDGRGYPLGLKGVRIPLTARILSVADIYDQIRSERSYRSALTLEEARQHLLERSGTQFDPAIVAVFLEHADRLEAEIDAQGLSYAATEPKSGTDHQDPKDNFVKQIKLANKEIFTLYKLAREFGSSDNLDDMLSLFTNSISELVPFDTCAVYLLDNSKQYANATHVYGENREVLASRRIKVGEGATGVALKKRQLVKNVNPDLDFSLSQIDLIQQYSTMAALPLIADDDLIGAVSIYSNELSAYGDEHLRLFETISRFAAEAIGKSKQHAEAQANALTDPMTELPNARSLQIQFDKEVGRATRTGNAFQVLVMDLDGFKAVNDTFGHKVGDQMLREVGQVILNELRDYDFLSRYGGDEFVALIPETDYKDVADLCARIEAAVAEFRLPVGGNRSAYVGVSLGAAGYPEGGSTFDQMIVAADKAMYSRKFSRKQVGAFEPRAPSAPLPDLLKNQVSQKSKESELADGPSGEGFIVELDESHVIRSGAVH